MAPRKKVTDPDSDSEGNDVKSAKKQKTTSDSGNADDKAETKAGSSESKEVSGTASVQKNKDGDRYIDLKGNKRATVRQFKGKTLVDIREFYSDKSTGEMLPGKKGISLSVEQWKALRGAVDQIDDIINDLE